ncbi:preprotein translocase subunit YajC [Blastochloris sulfoviridis]|uniref:Sec translocon accessory complex subunit YajC n=1 Tax=Blastochloris sulfoviridis TaxID=50712 RepID=A0A5M6I1M2_9HYPH|nr:preprotein translocase subunit YajC [Blastochloris sulfoviridis]KAA5602091.1 preprotein translocase subunit YajC [Blastochloris sulfoviridis]NJL09033.1 preprotein translocase subunit YajC [Candidatus Methylacidiphilales bacterium]
MFISPAFAQSAPLGAGGGTDMLLSLMPFVLIFIIMYFLILRPQQKRAKAHEEMVKNLRRGDMVVTAGGMIAKISKVIDDHEIELQLGEGLKVRQIRGMITEVRSKSEPVKDDAAG